MSRRKNRALRVAALPLVLSILGADARARPPSLEPSPRLTDASASLLPIEMLQGRSMDAEFADLNADGLPDLVVAAEFGQNVVLLSGPGGLGAARNAIPRGRIHDSEDIAIADFDRDGRPDIVFVAEDDQTNEMYLQTSPGVFIDASDRLPSPGGISNSVLAIDIDEDGDMDLLIGNQGANALLINDGDANFAPDTSARMPTESRITQDIEAGDIDGDGDTDLVLANEDGVSVWVRDRLGAYFVMTDDLIPELPQIEIREADLGDLDNDGDLDLVLANVGWRPGNDPRNRVLVNNGDGSFTDITADTPMSGHNTLDADIVDLDGDGDRDILWGASSGGPPLEVWINDGISDGKVGFTNATPSWVAPMTLTHTIDIEAVDLNGDGVLDVYLANHVTADKVLVRESLQGT